MAAHPALLPYVDQTPLRERTETRSEAPERERLTWRLAALIIACGAVMITGFGYVLLRLTP
jgi:hypothetical protein